MKNYLLIIAAGLTTTLVFFSFSVHAQTSEFDQLLNAFKSLYKGSTDCDPRLKDSQGNCVKPDDVIQACLAEGKRNKAGQIDPACCLINEQCEANRKPGDPVQTCTIGNDFCKSGFSCDDHKTNSPGANPAPTTASSNPNPTSMTAPTRANTQRDNFSYYCQGNNEWRDKHNLDQAGCGPTSMAMLLTHFGINMNPWEVDNIFRQNRWRACDDCGTSMQAILTNRTYSGYQWITSYGFTIGPNLATSQGINIEEAKRHLNNGYIIVASSNNFRCGGGCTDQYAGRSLSHIFLVDNIDDRGKVRVRDPSNCIWPRNASNNGDEVWEDYHLYRNASEINFYAYPVKKL